MEQQITLTKEPMIFDAKKGMGMDLTTRLLKDRILHINGPINSATSEIIVNSLIYLEGQDPEKEIKVYINSPGGVITDGMAIYDTMQHIKCPVSTIAVGLAASMGAFLLAAGDKGKRYALPNAEILIHQPLGGASGQATEIDIAAKHILKIRDSLNHILAERCNQPIDEIEKNTERDNWMTAQEALEFGVIDAIMRKEK